jgi:thiamine-phosphate pyrophosphorylase
MALGAEISSLRLYAITRDGAALDPQMPARVRAWLRGGVRAIQLREKRLGRAALLHFGRWLRATTREYGALFIVNDDPMLARLLEADGVHLGQTDGSIAEARELLGSEAIIGLSTHNREQVLAATNSGADYIGVGPIFATTTKDSEWPVLGPEFAGWAARESALPIVAIGGINLVNVETLVALGCRNAAVVSALNHASDPAETARAFLHILNSPENHED